MCNKKKKVNNTEYDKRDCKWIARLPQYYGEDAAKKVRP